MQCRKQIVRYGAVIGLGLMAALSSCSNHANLPSGWKQQSYLITYCCSAPPKQKNLETAAKEHFNFVPASEEALNYASRYGLKVMLEHPLLSPDTVLCRGQSVQCLYDCKSRL